MASATLLLPQPLGPTMAVTPRSKDRCDRSENDLNPAISICCKRMADPWLKHVTPWRAARDGPPARPVRNKKAARNPPGRRADERLGTPETNPTCEGVQRDRFGRPVTPCPARRAPRALRRSPV